MLKSFRNPDEAKRGMIEMAILHKLEVLRYIYPNEAELDLILEKLLETALNQHRLRLERYDRDLHQFEKRFGIDAPTFHQRFESGKMGDAMDFFEWAGLYELRQDVLKKIQHLESVL